MHVSLMCQHESLKVGQNLQSRAENIQGFASWQFGCTLGTSPCKGKQPEQQGLPKEDKRVMTTSLSDGTVTLLRHQTTR